MIPDYRVNRTRKDTGKYLVGSFKGQVRACLVSKTQIEFALPKICQQIMYDSSKKICIIICRVIGIKAVVPPKATKTDN
eukprot:4607088-Ditylum_brightwellii.AAC.1